MVFVDTSAPRVVRKNRRPKHPYNTRCSPFTLSPFLMAPVMPGETLKNLLIQSRVRTLPLNDPLIGWWHDYAFFYVKHRDLASSSLFQKMMLDPTEDMSSVAPSTSVPFYQTGSTGGINWLGQCLQMIVTHYFREDTEGYYSGDTPAVEGGIPGPAHINANYATRIKQSNWMQSGVDSADVTFDTADIPETGTMEQMDAAYQQWMFLKMQGLAHMTYEDYLKSYGVRGKLAEKQQIPELLGYFSKWQFPSNTINPSTGAASSAVVWSCNERIDKDFFFPEPGFIVGVKTTRAKVYLNKQKTYASAFLDNNFMWLPAMLDAQGQHQVSIRTFDEAVGPLAGNITADYIVDMRDLFMYGDQFVAREGSFTIGSTTTSSNLMALPAAGFNQVERNYPTEAMVDGLFVSGDCQNGVEEDGLVSLTIASNQRDFTP